tara:strand:- start:208 stop:399 length:192 start_codon:yes stop_codon:yes gene_type:complete
MAFKMKTPFLQQYLTEFEEQKAKDDKERQDTINARNQKLYDLAVNLPKRGMCPSGFWNRTVKL